MLKRIFLALFALVFWHNSVIAEELKLQPEKIYVLNFEQEILNINYDKNNLSAEILHTIYEDKKQLVISLKKSDETFLQVKTGDNLYNYEIKPAQNSSENLIMLDYPPIENLDVDIYKGD